MSKSTVATMVLGSILIMTITGSAMGEYREIPKDMLVQKASSNVEILSRQANETAEPQPINLYLYGGAGGLLKAEYPGGNSSTEVNCPISNTARLMGVPVGTWTSAQITLPITLNAEIFGSIWAKSDQGAKGVHFRIIVQVNGDNTDTWIETGTQDLSSMPVEFTGSDNGAGELQLNPGDKIGVQVIYFAEPKYFIGPNSASTMLVGSVEHDTRITVTTSPMVISVNEPIIGIDFLTFSATFTDAFTSSKLNARLIVDGMVDVETLSDPTFSIGGNGSIVSWDWDYKADGGRCGEYTITISLSYSEENEFRTMGTYILEFPERHEDEGILGGLGWLIPVIIIAIIIAVIAVVIKFVIGRRRVKALEPSSG